MSEGSEAYTSFLRISTTDAVDDPASGWPRPGDVTDATDATLRELRRRAVDPVVAGVLRPGELEELSVHRGENGSPGDVWVRLAAGGEAFTQLLSSVDREGEPRAGVQELAARLADQLEDWVCQTTFAWGERRSARYTCPDQPDVHPGPVYPWNR